MHKKDLVYSVLKCSLAVVFVWFGLLKFFDVSPVKDLVFASTPFLRWIPYSFTLLALFEVAVGVMLFFRRTAFIAAVLIMAHLVFASLSVLFTSTAWYPVFPRLSIPGEFVIKNFVLVAAAWVIAQMERKA